MGKRLKRRVRELCGLEGLSGEERQKRARQILNDNSFKQYLCNQVLGLTFKDIEITMKAVLADRRPASEYEEEAIPEKFSKDPAPPTYARYSREVKYRDLTMEEAVALIEASRAPFEQPDATVAPQDNYSTYSPEEVADLIAGTYDPRKYKHLRRRR